MAVILIPLTTAAQSPDFTVSGEQLPVTISATGLAGAETIPIEFYCAGQWLAITKDSAAVVLSATVKQLLIAGTGRYRVVKGTTAGQVAVQIDF